MDDLDRKTLLRLERLRFAWDHHVQEAAAHRQFYLQLFGIAATAALATAASSLVGQLSAEVVRSVLAGTLALAVFALWRLRRLPRRLRQSLRVVLHSIDRLMAEDAK